MSSTDPGKRLATLIKRLRARFGPALADDPPNSPSWIDPLVDELIYSCLLWEATTSQARNAFKRLKDAYIDYNELRVGLPEETAAVLGERYPRGEERAARLRAILFDLYQREYAVSLSSQVDGGKRDTRSYLESLDGIPPFVVDRMMLIRFGGHAVPTDERLAALLAANGVLSPSMTAQEAASWLSRQIKAEDAHEVWPLLRAWSDEETPDSRKARQKASASSDASSDERPQRRKPTATRRKAVKGGEA
ncbi:MAG: hypothetical protein KF787_10530 [Phycisphaeraceae bacterium]|nr:hypothetical protein [Phycisphaerae bacterium]MBX3393071.1 hypothetical protein [Phycisphaeraceae bacterium]